MDHPSMDLRRFPRVRVEEGCTLRFQTGGRNFFGLPVDTLGGGGCCFSVAQVLASALKQGTVLERLFLECPGLPLAPQRGRITWVTDCHPHDPDPVVRVGVELLEPDPDFLLALERCVNELLRRELRP